MKKSLFLILISLLLFACKNGPQYVIGGTYGTGNDTLYLFGLDSRYDRVDEIVCDEQGDFSHSIDMDTVAPLGLALPDGTLLTLFAEPSVEARLLVDSIKGSGWLVKGGREQALYDSIANILLAAESNSARLVHIDRFIKENPYSTTNIEVIRRFMVETPNPNNGFTLKRIQNLGGILQDHEFFIDIKERIENKNSNTLYKMFPSFEYTTFEGKKITSRSYKDKLLIVNFWASWDSLSRAEIREQSAMMLEKDTSNIAMLNISLDYDLDAWRKCVQADSLAGDNVCDGRAWDNETVKRFNVSDLTFTVVVSPYQRIDIFNLANERFSHTIDSLKNKYFTATKNRKNRK